MPDLTPEITALETRLARMTEERDRLAIDLRRAHANTLPALFLSLVAEFPALAKDCRDDILAAETDAIRSLAALDSWSIDEPMVLISPPFIGTSMPRLTMWGLGLAAYAASEGLPLRFYLREPRAAVPADPKVAAWEASVRSAPCPSGSHGSPEVEAAVMVRRVAS